MKPLIFDGYRGDAIASFHEMKAAGIVLCIFKASQGSASDSAFQDFACRARSVGMLVGAYHFGVDDDGAEQAEHFLSLLSPGTMMVLDFERYPNSQMSVSQAEEFVLECRRVTGVLPVLYYGELLRELESLGRVSRHSVLRDCPAWISRYSSKQPVPIAGMDLVMWQYTGDGEGPLPHTVAGVNNNADLSVWVGSPADIPRFVAKHSFVGCSHR